MKLRRLTLQGFKSFADKTDLRFHEGITAIVGPNGCGKSNISDAIRWVLGEQRPTAIRGSKMEEAIFQGTTQRRPVNRAEVSLAFDNLEGRLPLPEDEVEIRRVVFREGGSDYQLNRDSVRLRDILDMCRDTGLGANAYTVIEQGMVDAILSDRPEERRHMFEEAAGIGRYKDRRKVAQRRLEAAETDLSRLNDLITEVDAKVRNLGRQRKRAQKYGEYRARRLALEVAVAQHELQDIRAKLERAEAMLDAIGRNEPAARAALTTTEAQLERLRIESAEALRERADVATRLEEISRQIAEREREIAVAEERRAHSLRRLEQIAGERDELRARASLLETELRELEAERHGQHGIVESLAVRVAEVQERQTWVAKYAKDLERAKSLQNTRAMSASDYDLAEGAYLAAKAQHARTVQSLRVAELGSRPEDIAAAEAEVQRLEAKTKRLREDIQKTTIRSPVSGFITQRYTEVGQWLERGGKVVDLVDLRMVLIRVPVHEKDVSRVRVGDEATIGLDALPNRPFTGRVKHILPQADAASRTFPVKIEVANTPDSALKAGMFARVRLRTGTAHPGLFVPKDAVVRQPNGLGVFVVQDDKAHMVPIKTGRTHDGLIEVLEGGLQPGNTVVVTGNETLRDQAAVVIKGNSRN